MKTIFISFDQAHYENIVKLLDKLSCKGFTAWEQVIGRGSKGGEPHYGSHAWPSLSSAMLVVADDDKVNLLLDGLKELDGLRPKLGLRAFVWNVESAI
ncbi:MAG: hypothetical protein R3Y22_06525 [Bacteroidales bacterium]